MGALLMGITLNKFVNDVQKQEKKLTSTAFHVSRSIEFVQISLQYLFFYVGNLLQEISLQANKS